MTISEQASEMNVKIRVQIGKREVWFLLFVGIENSGYFLPTAYSCWTTSFTDRSSNQ